MADANAAYEQAEERIAKALADGSDSLDLGIEGLTDIPPEIAGLTALTELDLRSTQITDLAPIAGLTALKGLYLHNTQVTDLVPIAGLTALTELYLGNTQVTDLAPIAGLTALTDLYLGSTPVTDLAPIAGLTALIVLYLTNTEVTDLAPIAGLTALTRLYLRNTKVTDLVPIAGLTVLTRLDLNNSQVTDLRPIKNCEKLDEDGISGLWFSDTPALRDPELARLNEIGDSRQRARETLAYLQTLPPYPEPLPWLDSISAASDQKPTDPTRPKVFKSLTMSQSRTLLEKNYPLVHDRCQAVVAELDESLAYHRIRIPNDPDALAEHLQIEQSLTFAKGLIASIHDALPEGFTDQPMTDAQVSLFRDKFNAELEKLHNAMKYIDRPDHTPTLGGVLKLGCAGAVGSVIALVPGVNIAAAVPAVYTALYGKDAAKGVISMFKDPS